MPSSSTSAPKFNTDWNAVWASKDIRQLTKIPTNRKGLCGCIICGHPREVTGRLFRSHMMELYGSRPSPLKRVRELSPAPSAQTRDVDPIPSLDDSAQAADVMDFEYDHDAGPSLEPDVPGGQSDAGSDREDEVVQEDVEHGQEGADDQAFSAAELATMLEYADDFEYDVPPLEPISPIPSPSTSPSSTPLNLSLGPFISANAPSGDLIDRWPYNIPLAMREPEYSGARFNPHLVASNERVNHPVLHRLLPVLAVLLSGVFNVARRPIELVLQACSAIIRYAEKIQYHRFKDWYIANHPNSDASLLEELDMLDPSFEAAASPATLATALKHIQVETALIVHPQCRNPDCHHVFLDIQERDLFSTVPILCPDCKTPTRNSKGEVWVLHFPRRSLKAELEVVMRTPGVEDAIERRGERKQQRDEEDGEAPWGKVYRQQDDGSAWRTKDDTSRRALSITVNLSIDWAQQSTRRSGAQDSIGPITLQIADLPAQLRSSFSCVMLMGITPGPKAPKAINLHKLLVPLVMELRDAELNGIWCQTPSYPQGRLIYVMLGCICCDRPAACEVTGAGPYQAKATPCLRCHVHSSQVADLDSYPHPPRDSYAHSVGLLDQIVSVPLAVEADRQRHADEQAEAVRRGERKVPYTAKMKAEAVRQATVHSGNISALTLLPGFDKFAMTVFDPMHSLLEGAVKTYMHRVLVLGAHGSEGDADRADPEGEREGAVADEGYDGIRGDFTDGGDIDEEDRVSTAGETDFGSETEARQAHGVATRVLEQINRGEIVTATPAEREVLRKGVSKMGKTRSGKRKESSKGSRKKKMSPTDMRRLHAIISNVQTPSSIPRLHPQFGTPTAGTPTANHWRMFATIYAPLSIPLLFRQRGIFEGRAKGGNPHLSPSELKAFMLVFEIVAVSLRPSISERQLTVLESLIRSFQTLAFTLHPTLSKSSNLHVISHLADDIRRFGPTYGWWTFLIERINYVIKNVNQSGGNRFQASVIALRAATKAREVVSARMRAFTLSSDDNEDDKAIVEELSQLFDAVSHNAASDVLQQVSLRYAEIELHTLADIGTYSTSRVVVKPRGKCVERSLPDILLKRLQDCLSSWGTPTRTMLDINVDDSLPYLPTKATFWEGILYAGRRLDVAQWEKTIHLSVDTFEATALVSNRNSLFESRRTAWIYGCDDRRAITGVLCAVFEHQMQLADGSKGHKHLYAVIRRLRPFEGEDIYGYRSHPSLGVWLWDVDVLADAIVIRLTDSTIDTLRPLAINRLPQTVDEDGKPGENDVWATIPIHHH